MGNSIVWTRGEPGEILDANRPILAKLARLIKERQQDEVLGIIENWPPADVMAMLLQMPL